MIPAEVTSLMSGTGIGMVGSLLAKIGSPSKETLDIIKTITNAQNPHQPQPDVSDVQAAREDKSLSGTRRIISFMLMLGLLGVTLGFSAVFGIPTVVEYDTNGTLLSLFGIEIVGTGGGKAFKTIAGGVVTQEFRLAVLSCIGLYFGSRITKS